MSVIRFLSAQLREPEGWFGKLLMGRLLNRANRRLAENTVRALNLGANDTVLEIGFGGGNGLAAALSTVTAGKVHGVDISHSMLEHVQKAFRREIADGRLQVRLGDVAKLPYQEGMFDGVFAVNNVYFWPDAEVCLREVRRVLKDGGRIGIGNRSKEHMSRFAVTQHGFRLFSGADLEALLREGGFRDISVEHRQGVDRGKFPDQVIGIGTR